MARQEEIRAVLGGMPDELYKEREVFLAALEAAASNVGLKLSVPVKRAILAALGERDETAAVCRGKDGKPEADPKLRDTERVPLPEGEDCADESGVPASVRAFFDREVGPHVPDAWIDTRKRDHRDGDVGLVGYEINFNRYFYRYKPPRPLEEIQADIRAVQTDIVRMLAEVAGTTEPEGRR